MKLSLYLKFILAYIVFGIAGFVAIATISSHLTYSYLVDSRSQTLYDEANLIASTYSTVYEGQNISLAESYPQLKAVATFLNAKISRILILPLPVTNPIWSEITLTHLMRII